MAERSGKRSKKSSYKVVTITMPSDVPMPPATAREASEVAKEVAQLKIEPEEKKEKAEQKKSKKKATERPYSAYIFDLKQLVSHSKEALDHLSKLLQVEDSDKPPIRGAMAMIKMAKMMLRKGFTKMGAITDASKTGHGTSSVTTGLMVHKKDQFGPGVMLFLACGSGGAKWQAGEVQEDGQVRVYKEAKDPVLGKWKGANQLTRNTKEEGKFFLEDLEALRLCLDEDRLLAIQQINDELKDSNPLDLPFLTPETPVYVYITGTLREFWEQLPAEQQQALENTLKTRFIPQGWNTEELFLKQSTEAFYERLAVPSVYHNLARDQLIEEVDIEAVSGIGMGSCQNSFLKEGEWIECNLPIGMKSQKWEKDLQDFVKKLEKFLLLENNVKKADGGFERFWACKSGFTIQLYNDDEFFRILTQPLDEAAYHEEMMHYRMADNLKELTSTLEGILQHTKEHISPACDDALSRAVIELNNARLMCYS
jgi:hypothetical protein